SRLVVSDICSMFSSVSLSFFLSLLCCFFSSRRRHTTSKRDWSSDVCSSDLAKARGLELLELFEQLETGGLRRLSGQAVEPGEVEIGRASCRERGQTLGGAVR